MKTLPMVRTLVAAMVLIAGGMGAHACDWCDARAEGTEESRGGWTTPSYGYDYNPGYGYGDYDYSGYGYDTPTADWSQYSTWSSGEMYSDGSSSFYSNYGATDSTYGYVGNDGDMIINAGGTMWWPGK